MLGLSALVVERLTSIPNEMDIMTWHDNVVGENTQAILELFLYVIYYIHHIWFLEILVKYKYFFLSSMMYKKMRIAVDVP